MSPGVRPAGPTGSRGFSLLEVLVALAIFATVVGIVLSGFAEFGRNANTEQTVLEVQQSARVTIDELARTIQQTGYNIGRADPYNPTHWQRGVIHAGAHAFAFNADIDPAVGPLANTVTLTFPDGETYGGEGAAASVVGAETYVYTLDANGDDSITDADRSAAVTEGRNPAADTENPLDFALFRRIHGYDGSSYGGTLVAVAPHLFTNATPTIRYPDGTTPEPLFTYWLTEDLDGNGTLAPTECVNDAIAGRCPPAIARNPVLYLWGDTNFDGRLSETEKSALRDMPVGSTRWSKNRLTSEGSYKSSSLTMALNSSSADSYIVKVAEAAKFGVGQFVVIGTGRSAETLVIEAVDDRANAVYLATDPVYDHPSGSRIEILPQTLLGAIRTVQINYDAIMPKKDVSGGAAVAGRMGHRGTRGLDYRVVSLEKSVELMNLQTDPLVGASSVLPPACPVTIRTDCAGSSIGELRAYSPSARPTAVTFLVTDPSGMPMKGVPLDFTHTAPSLGALSLRKTKTDENGRAIVHYTVNSTIGDDTVTATATCVDAQQHLATYASEVTVRISQVEVSLVNDCLSTVGTGLSAPGTAFTLTARDSAGVMKNVPVQLRLEFDPAYVPPDPDYSTLEGELFVESRSAGKTDATGKFTPVDANTGGSGVLGGRLALTRETPGQGTRLNLLTTPLPGACAVAGSTVSTPLTFYKLVVDSETPSVGCTEISPCRILAGSRPPRVAATLSVNSQAIAGATVDFTKTDVHTGTPPGASTLSPGSTVTTDSSGKAIVQVGNNGAATITSSQPLETTLGASSIGPSSCTAGSIALGSLRMKFEFEGEAGECETDMQRSWVKKIASDKVCTNVKNDNSSAGCPIRPTGISVTVFRPDGVNPDNIFKLDRIEGGVIDGAASCNTTGKVRLFDRGCNGGRSLPNGQRWDFANVGTCVKPPHAAAPGQYFVLNNLDFTTDVAGKDRRIDFTVYYECEGSCPAGESFSRTFSLVTPK